MACPSPADWPIRGLTALARGEVAQGRRGRRQLFPLWDLRAGWTQAVDRLVDMEKAGQAGIRVRENSPVASLPSSPVVSMNSLEHVSVVLLNSLELVSQFSSGLNHLPLREPQQRLFLSK